MTVFLANWRSWPGPRVWYAPYNAASRAFMRALRAAVERVRAPRGAAIERASIDVELAACDASRAEAIARELMTALGALPLEMPVSVGVAPNKLLAKLASSRTKPPLPTRVRVLVVRTAANVAALLERPPAHKLPGLGAKARALATLLDDLGTMSAPPSAASL